MTNEYDIRKFDKITKMRKEGFYWDEIEEYFYNSDGSAKNFYYGYKGSTVSKKPPVTIEFKDKIKKLKHDGFTYSQIATELETTKNAVAGLVNRWKL